MRQRSAIGRTIQLPVGPVHVRQDGPPDGPVVVLLHGFASSMHSFDRVVSLLAADRQVVRVDLLGHGCSTNQVTDFGSDAQAAMVVAALDRLGVEPEAVVGHSFGADVAIAVAEQSRRVGRLVVIGQAPDFVTARVPRGGALLGHRVLGPLLHRAALAPTVNRASRFAFAPGTRAALLFDRRDRRVLDVRATAPAVYRTVLVDRPAALARRGLDTRLAALALPTLVILGGQDQLYPVEATRARYAALPGVRIAILADSGHSPPLEAPEETARLIRDFTGAGPGAATEA